MLYIVPSGANDDWYWIYATVNANRKNAAYVVRLYSLILSHLLFSFPTSSPTLSSSSSTNPFCFMPLVTFFFHLFTSIHLYLSIILCAYLL